MAITLSEPLDSRRCCQSCGKRGLLSQLAIGRGLGLVADVCEPCLDAAVKEIARRKKVMARRLAKMIAQAENA